MGACGDRVLVEGEVVKMGWGWVGNRCLGAGALRGGKKRSWGAGGIRRGATAVRKALGERLELGSCPELGAQAGLGGQRPSRPGLLVGTVAQGE